MTITSSRLLGSFVNFVVPFAGIVIFNYVLLFTLLLLGGKDPKNMPLSVGQYTNVSAGKYVSWNFFLKMANRILLKF